jgi:endoglucanase
MRTLQVVLAAFALLIANCDAVKRTDSEIAENRIKLNQLGYRPEGKKIAIVPDSYGDEFRIISTTRNEAVFTGQLSVPMQWPLAGDEYFRHADFSSLNSPGQYYIIVGSGKSDTFIVSDDVYDKVHDAALKAYYFNRAGAALAVQHAGAYARKAGHPDTEVMIHASAASAQRPAGSIISSPKGWYDAGDYGKYIVNSGITTYTLLAAYEHFPDFYKNRSLNIPESEDEIPDLLNEILWNLDWMETMQDSADGGVYHKLTTLNFAADVMPHKTNEQRYVVQKSTAATLNFAATMAAASRIFAADNNRFPGKAETYRQAALKAWQWAVAHPNAVYRQPEDVSTGAYADRNLQDEFSWAAAELYLLTGERTYLDKFFRFRPSADVPAWQRVAALGFVSLIQHCDSLPPESCRKAADSVTASADVIVEQYQQSEYLVPMVESDFVWGSNSVVLNKALLLVQAYRIHHQPVYLEATFGIVDYILGKNPTAYSFVTGSGHRSPKNIHHRPSKADHIVDPVPGWLVGGPHSGWEDQCTYPSRHPAKSYLDDWCSYSTNEIAINWNAALVYVLAAVESLH